MPPGSLFNSNVVSANQDLHREVMRISLGVTADFDSPPVTESDGNATDLPVENRYELFSEACIYFGEFYFDVEWAAIILFGM